MAAELPGAAAGPAGAPGGSLGSHIQLFSMSRGSNGPSERASIHARCAHMSLRAIKRKSWLVLLEARALRRGEERRGSSTGS